MANPTVNFLYFDTYGTPTSASNASVRIVGNWFNADGSGCQRWAEYGISSYSSSLRTKPDTFNTNGSLAPTLTGLTADKTYSFARHLLIQSSDGNHYSSNATFKTYAQVAVMPAPASSSVTSTTATITSNSYTTNVVESTYTTYLYYKKTADTIYDLATSGTANPLSSNLTGLTSSTQYSFFARIIRTTLNGTTVDSSVGNFTTAPGAPSTTTNAASSVAATSAVLNQTAVINAGTTVTAYWKYGIQNPPTDTTTASQSISADGSYSVATGTLVASTLYYAQAFLAFATPAGSPSSGSVVSFTTSSDPAAEAAAEDHLTIQEYDAVYGVQKAFVFLAASPSATSSNVFLSAAAPWTTGECAITIDGGAVGTCANAPTRIGTSAFYTITLTAGELAGENIWVHINDTGAAARDVAIHIRTSIEVGKVVLSAAAMTNTTALTVTGIGSGSAAIFTAGATGNDITGVLTSHSIRRSTATAGGASTITLDASASATNDYYNGCIIITTGGTGPNQSRFITDYDGTTKVATVSRAWSTNPANGTTFNIIPVEDVWAQAALVELSAIPTVTSSWADKLEFLWQRFAYKRTQTATVHTMTKADSSTALGTAAVSDNGTTQSFGKIA